MLPLSTLVVAVDTNVVVGVLVFSCVSEDVETVKLEEALVLVMGTVVAVVVGVLVGVLVGEVVGVEVTVEVIVVCCVVVSVVC